MKNFDRQPQLEVMPCGATKKTITELEQEGWESLLSFHHHIPEQWKMACEQAQQAVKDDLYEVVLVLGQNEMEKRNGVQYLYKKKTQKLLDLEKQNGY